MKHRDIKDDTVVRVLYRDCWGRCRVVDKCLKNGIVVVQELDRIDNKIIRHYVNAGKLIIS